MTALELFLLVYGIPAAWCLAAWLLLQTVRTLDRRSDRRRRAR